MQCFVSCLCYSCIIFINFVIFLCHVCVIFEFCMIFVCHFYHACHFCLSCVSCLCHFCQCLQKQLLLLGFCQNVRESVPVSQLCAERAGPHGCGIISSYILLHVSLSEPSNVPSIRSLAPCFIHPPIQSYRHSRNESVTQSICI